VIDVNGELIEVKIYKISPNSVKLAMSAKPDVKIFRKELLDKSSKEDRESLNRVKESF
jgi:sRNA-binding carbon storage regulator CsrA